jgi:hypothetical protein
VPVGLVVTSRAKTRSYRWRAHTAAHRASFVAWVSWGASLRYPGIDAGSARMAATSLWKMSVMQDMARNRPLVCKSRRNDGCVNRAMKSRSL